MSDPQSPTRSSHVRAVLPAALCVIAATALVLRVVSIAQPLGIDQGLWASAVRGMSRGQLLYRDVWEQRPPGIYWIYLAGFHVFGWKAATVAWLDVVAATVTTSLLFAVARLLSGALTAAAAAALYAALTMPAWLYRHSGFLERSVSETFIVVCVGLSAWCAATHVRSASLLAAAGVGLFGGAAVVLKPNAALYLPAMLAWMLLYRNDRTGGLRAAGVPLGAALAASAVVPIVAISWLWMLGILGEARTAVVDFNRYYVSQGFVPSVYAVDFSKAVWLRMKTEPLWVAGGLGALVATWRLARDRRLPALAGLCVIWGGTAALVIVVNGARLFNSYFIQALPPLALIAAWMLADWPRASTSRRIAGIATAGLMLLVMGQRHYATRVLDAARADFEVLRGRMDRTTYLERFGSYDNRRGYSARANAELAAYVREHTSPEQRIFLFGINGAEVYFAADRLTAHRFLRVNFFVATDFPDARFRLDAVVDDLRARRPVYLIFERLHSSSEMAREADALPDHPAIAHLLSAYTLETRIEDFTLYRLKE